MTRTAAARLELERDLLAALFLWPRRVQLERRDFLAPEHGALFEVIEEAAALYPPAVIADDALTYDAAFLTAVVAMARDHVVQGYVASHVFHAGEWAQWAKRYILDELLTRPAARAAIDRLVAEVRQCPRCGR
jgi:hypothetical protein